MPYKCTEPTCRTRTKKIEDGLCSNCKFVIVDMGETIEDLKQQIVVLRKAEFDRNQKKAIEDGTYMDDGGIEMTCSFCGIPRPMLSVPCCDRIKTEQAESDKMIFDGIRKAMENDAEDYTDR
jgi:hypothetical protein